ncbi:aminopeptidase P family protein [Georgenia sp. TF02-10]|uniref:aminopeptidase P family protein n=1 Tax=Georgenia sp. TF02-10 TaxID=2917725 RepID=UPI001FA81440|nr:aminopeptidase P family protein [Georgenia sp. TF02-10]UNX55111.1 aminopeptidase P family protein [Georgenia sp. TF02-10]
MTTPMTTPTTTPTTTPQPTPPAPPRPRYAGTRPPRLTEVPAFTRAIAEGWAPTTVPAPVPPGAAAAAAEHRRRLSEQLPGRTVVVAAGRAPVRSNDTSYDFRPDSDFLWLTGCAVEDAVLVLRPRGSEHDPVLYLPASARPGDHRFFSDAAQGELWVGPSAGLAEWAEALGIPVRPLTELDELSLTGADAGRRVDETLLRRHGIARSAELARVCSDLRMIKDAWEVGELRRAVDHTVEGFAAVLAEVPTAVQRHGERWLQGTFDRYARAVGNGPGYATIVGSAGRSATLHWVRCDGPVEPDAVLLLDMGVEERSCYTADVTRTVPPSGRFSPAQRQVHDLVEAAHRAGLSHVRPGAQYSDFHFAAMEVIAEGLHDWGLLGMSVDEALSPQGQLHRRYLVCGIGHHLGLDVHDCAHSDYEQYQGATMAPGMVLTVEPGLYFHSHDLTVPPELRGTGIRIEDDLLVTGTGAELLSAALPIDADGIERWAREAMGVGR